MNLSKLDIHTEEDFKRVLVKAGKTITCSWFIGAIRHRKRDNRWVPVIMFADEDKEEFAYCFELGGGETEILAFIARLREVQRKCDDGNRKP